MKFSTENTSALNIFTEGEFSENKIKLPEKETEPTKARNQRGDAACCAETRRELSLARLALSTQESRWRQLLSAEARLRRRQLNSVLAALLGLERRLRSEQASIRAQLAARDNLIRQQALEIARLRRAARRTKTLSLPIENSNSPGSALATEESSKWNGHHDSLESLSSKTSESDTAVALKPAEPTNSILKEERDESCQTEEHDHSYLGRHEDFADRDLYKVYNHNPVLECVNQILLRDQDEGDAHEYKFSNRDKLNEKERRVKFTYTCSSIEEEQEDQEEHDGVMENANEKSQAPVGATTLQNLTEKKNEEEFDIVKEVEKVAALHKKATELKLEQMRWAIKEKTPSPPTKAQHLEEKACLMMSSQGLTLVRNVELEEVDKNEARHTDEKSVETLKKEVGKSVLKEENTKVAIDCPAADSGRKEVEKLSCVDQKMGSSSLKDSKATSALPKRPIPPALPPKPPQLGSLLLMRRQGKLGPARVGMSQGYGQDYYAPRQLQLQRQRQILSNGSLAVARAHDDAAAAAAAGAARPARQLAPDDVSAIRVGCSVSSLITGSAGGSIVTELTRGQAQEQAMVGDDSLLRSNFEEFRLEEVDVDVGRADGDGAEEARAPPSPSPAQLQQQQRDSYESFLEATGLSQKAILTPSRLLSNHRSVLKPKDVKHRSRVLRGDRNSAPLVRYWVEPFL
ncbi:uncharacterized protein LOC126248493 [Schistocerca nitens]|uniref:uncharacterized protein LOC126248493 n=1 Tax=Schistocerca nitens TaxID=7011 RepID=UPI0021178952|nr:uncharacterized protein LOC126248493 [Schistocerca nitens]